MSFVRELVKNGLSSALHQYFEKERHVGEDHSREVAAERSRILKTGPVVTNRGLFHKTKQQSIKGDNGWRIEVQPDCPSPKPCDFDDGASHVYPTVQEAQDNRCKPCPHCYADQPKNLIGQL